MAWDDTCARCGNTIFWWHSRLNYLVCMVCEPNPLDALAVLARRAGADAVKQVERLQDVTTPETMERPN